MKNYLKKNKGLFLLPLGLIPFLILIFYILGGGKGEQEQPVQSQTTDGANYILPEAEQSIGILDKLEAYQQTAEPGMINTGSWEADSASSIDNKPKDSVKIQLAELAQQNQNLPEDLLAHIRQKELEARQELVEPEQTTNKKSIPKEHYFVDKSKVVKTETKQEKKPERQSTGIEELEKVFDENLLLNRENDSLKFYLEHSQSRLAQIEKIQNATFSLKKTGSSGFNKNEESGSSIRAEIYETTTVLDGTRVKLRLLDDTRINGNKVPKNTFVYGICKVKNERLHIEISQMPVGENFLPVKLAIHDLDGLPGLYVPDNVARKVTQEVGAGTNTSSMLGVTGNPLTYAGIRAADRTAQILLKRVRLKKVTLRKNTLVYLINSKN